MPTDPDRDPRPPVPVAAAVMLGLVLGIFGYGLFFAVAFALPIGDPLAYVSLVALAPAAAVLAWLSWPHWRAVAACVALPTVLWSAMAFAFAAREGTGGATAHLVVAGVATACSTAGAFFGGATARRGAGPAST